MRLALLSLEVGPEICAQKYNNIDLVSLPKTTARYLKTPWPRDHTYHYIFQGGLTNDVIPRDEGPTSCGSTKNAVRKQEAPTDIPWPSHTK